MTAALWRLTCAYLDRDRLFCRRRTGPWPSDGTSASSGDGYPFGWFDAYDGKGGTFNAQFGTALGTDGERLLVSLDSDSFAAFGIDSSTPLWRRTLDDRYTLLAVGGKLYDRNRRLL
ncbi:hypothetical protein [Gordonia sp. FQ]|uniref:hypothetical protein n=1 Tax=Gordonia sp. FQ TaxID=3446634 RepID=UPI003F8280CD